MAWLCVSEENVRRLRGSGRIYAYRSPKGVNCPYLHRRADVEALIQDPQYQKRRQAWYKAQATRFNDHVEEVYQANQRHRRPRYQGFGGWPGDIW